MSNFNLSGVKASEEQASNVTRPVQPGYQTLTIVAVNDTTARSGSIGVEIEFKSDVENTYTFKQSFWLNNADGSLSGHAPAFANVVKAFTGAELPETVNSTQGIAALLVGRSKDVTVGGEKYTTEKDGVKYNNIRPQLPFGSFDGERKPFIRGEWEEQEESASTTDTITSPGTSEKANDLPW